MCVTFVVSTECESCTRSIPQTRRLRKRASVGERVGRVSSDVVSSWTRSPSCCGFRGVFRVGRNFFPCFFLRFFFLRTHTAASMRPPCLIYLSTSNEARPRERSDRGRFLPLSEKSLFISGCVQGVIILMVCRCAGVYVTFVVFTVRESCTRLISTNPGSMEAGECGRTRGTCFIAHRLEVVAVAGLL